MAGTPYLVDSNVLLRWVKPDDRDYPEWFTIVGIVGSVRHRAVESPTSPELYMCSQQAEAGRLLAPSDFALVVRSEGSISPLIGAVRSSYLISTR